jgi:F-type H+-transporting ATPase subunit b
MDLFKIEPGLAIWTWITFGILFLLLSKFVFPSLLKGIKTREALIAKSVDNATQIEKQLSDIEKEHLEIIKRSRSEAEEIIRKTRTEAEQIRKSLIEKAEQEARAILAQTKIKIEEERASVMEGMRAQIAVFACDTAEKIIGKSFVSQEDRKWVEELAKQV